MGGKAAKRVVPPEPPNSVLNNAAKAPRKAVQARWSKAAPATPVLDTSKKALHLCLKRIKDAKNENELRLLTEELQRIVFQRQYSNVE